jgi:E3 ubiquitin-protein ligase listerin
MSEIYIEDQNLGIGNNGVSISFNYFDSLPDNSLLSNIKDPNLLLNIKQLFKKDDTTKEKALNKILEMISMNPSFITDDINLLVWSMIYPKLIVSGSKNVTTLANEITTIIIKHVKDNKIKNLLPYFQDLFPILIFGMSDLDKKVSRAAQMNLNTLFNNDQQKIEGLYQHFKINLIKISYSLFCIETEETLYNYDASLKEADFIKSIKSNHINLKISAINLLCELVEKNDYSFIDGNEYFEEIMTNKEMYEMLTMKFIQNHGINGSKAILRLFILINAKLSGKNEEYWSSSSNKKILKLVSKHLFKLMNEWNESKQQLLSALSVDVIFLLDIFTNIDKFWEVSKTPEDSLYKWLGKGPGIFTPINYYRLLAKFNADISSRFNEAESFIDNWDNIWDACFEKELKRRDRFSNQYLEQFWIHYIAINKKFDELNKESVMSKMMITVSDKVVDPKLMIIFMEYQPSIISNLENKLKDLNTPSLESKVFVSNIISLMVTPHKEENNPIKSFCDQNIDSVFDYTLNSIDIESFIKIVNSKVFDDKIHLKSFFIPFLHKVDSSLISKIIRKINNKELIKQAVDTDPSLQSVLFNSDESLSKELMSIKTVMHFYENLESVEFFNKFNSLTNDLKVEFLMGNPSYVSEFVLTANELDHHDWYELFSACCKQSVDVALLVLSHLEDEYIDSSNEEYKGYLIGIVKELIQDNSQCVVNYLTQKNDLLNLENVFKDFQFVDDKLVTVIGLDSSVILFKDMIQDNYFILNKKKLKTKLKLLKFGAMLLNLLTDYNNLDEDVCFVNYNIVKLLCSHFSIITDSDEAVFDFEDDKFSILKKTPTIDDIHELILKQSTTNTYLNLMKFETSTNSMMKLYKSKLMTMLMNNAMDGTPETIFKTNFIDNNIEGVLLKCLRNSNSVSNFDHSFIYNVLYISNVHECYNDTGYFTKLENYLMSEFHQLSCEQFENNTYKYLIILINLLDNKHASASPHFNEMRLNGFIKNVINLYEDIDWYEDDIDYKKYLRSLFLRLLINLNEYDSTNSQILEFSQSLIMENLQICELLDSNDTSSYDLLQHCLKLLKLVETDESSMEEICEIIFNIFVHQQDLESDLIETCLLTYVNSKFLDGKFDELITLVKDPQFGLKKKRLVFLLLDKILKTERYINCIDFELDRKELMKSESEESSTSSNVDSELLKKYKINTGIIELLDVFENKDIVLYIWTVGLIMTYLENTTLHLFNLFMTQLGPNWFIERWFERVSMKVFNEDEKIDSSNVFSMDGSTDIKNITFRICKLLTSKSYLSVIYTWFNNLDKKESEFYSEYFSRFISKKLILEQMEQLQSDKTLKELEDTFSEFLSIEIKPELNLVKTKFDIDEQTLSIFYQYESDFPLKPIKATVKNNKIGINDKTLKTWLLAIKKNPFILSNISTVCNNIKLKFANLEECAICYYVINDTNKSLPNKKCPTCTKKFHNVCLYKWFKNSNSNACPLCRSNFTF